MAQEAILRGDVKAVEAFRIDAIDADDLDFARVNAIAQGVDHPVVLVLEEALLAGREYKEPLAAFAEDEEFHVPLEGRAVPFMVLAFHGKAGVT